MRRSLTITLLATGVVALGGDNKADRGRPAPGGVPAGGGSRQTAGVTRPLAAATAAAASGATLAPDSAPHSVVIEPCLLSLIDDVRVPAVEAGLLEAITVREGDEVRPKQELAQIDFTKAKLQAEVVNRQHQQAKLQSQNDIEVRYSKAQANVAEAEVDEALAANRLAEGAVSSAEVRRLQLTAHRSKLGIEQAQHDFELARWAEKVREAELDTAKHEIERRRIVSPLEGTVVEIVKRTGEWAQAGETVMRLVRMNRLRVEGFVDSSQLGDEELVDRPVKIVVQRQRGQAEEFAGKIVFVNPLVESGGNYRVWAEVENRRRDGRWVLRPGMEAQMTVELAQPVAARHDRSPASR